MIFRRFTDDGLAQFSYVVADATTGEAVVIDPLRDVDRYTNWLKQESLDLTAVLETHIHADYASGARELAAIASVPYYASKYDDNEKYEMAFDHDPVGDEHRVSLGRFTFEPVHTPGHTPEHISFLLRDGEGEPVKLFSGDFLFVHSLGRPDLIGEGSKRSLARDLYESVQEVKSRAWPGDLEIHPAHGAGSLCGAGLSETPSSTMAEEFENNPYFQIDDEEEFVETILEALGDFPPYYRRMKQTNSKGPPFVMPVEPPEALECEEVFQRYESSSELTVIDIRAADEFGEGHIPGAINLPYASRINRYGPWVIPYEVPIILVGDRTQKQPDMEQVYRWLIRVELDGIQGYLREGYSSWRQTGHPSEQIIQYTPAELRNQLESGQPPTVVDVRTLEEFEQGHLPGALWIPFGKLRDEKEKLPEDWDQPMVTVCSSGYRSTLSASLLKAMGYETVGHLSDGFPAWQELAGDVVTSDGGSAPT